MTHPFVHAVDDPHPLLLSSCLLPDRLLCCQCLRPSNLDFTKYHIHITSVTVYYNCSISLLVIVVDLLVCLIYNLNLITGMYVPEKAVIYRVGIGTICGFRQPLRVLEGIPCE